MSERQCKTIEGQRWMKITTSKTSEKWFIRVWDNKLEYLSREQDSV